MGEFYSGDWNDNLRYVNRFVIAPHNGVDPELYRKDTDDKYKVKALNGDQWLKLKADAKGSLSYSLSEANLPAWTNLINIGPKNENGTDNVNSIGNKPMKPILLTLGNQQ